ncbi:MAG: zf-TFIIB domain-containing protein [Dehalococcoidia bacterium]|nr:zf-TFIIB domain-containing protein [Dehalococcoidia bacterium]
MALTDDQWIAEARRQLAATGSWDIPVTPAAVRPPDAATEAPLPCPNCGRELEIFRRYEVLATEPLRWCPGCFGFWARGDALSAGVADPADDREALFAAEVPARCRSCDKGRLDAAGVCRGCGWTRPALACPSCGAPMGRDTVKGVELDACATCRATWFDIGELGRTYGLARPQSLAAAIVDETAGPTDQDLMLTAARVLLGMFLRLPF